MKLENASYLCHTLAAFCALALFGVGFTGQGWAAFLGMWMALPLFGLAIAALILSGVVVLRSFRRPDLRQALLFVLLLAAFVGLALEDRPPWPGFQDQSLIAWLIASVILGVQTYLKNRKTDRENA